MARIEKTVFISYRRTDVYTALAVYENLKNQGYDVFFDYRSISSGDFEQIITSNIRARAHFLLILTPTALDRCNEPGDWLRREIELAIDEKRNIVPLFFKGFRFGGSSKSGVSKWLPFGKPDVLTGKLGNLTRYNGLNVHEDYFDEAMVRVRTEFLNKPLNTVLHPVSTEVQKAVEEEQSAADEAIKKKQLNEDELGREKRQFEQLSELIAKFESKDINVSRVAQFELEGFTTSEYPIHIQELAKNALSKGLKSQAIRLELKGEFWDALQIYYKIKKLDPSFPRVDVKIQELEEETKPKPVADMDVAQIEPANPAPRKMPILWKPIAIIASVLMVIVLFILGGTDFWNDLFERDSPNTPVPIKTSTSESIITKTPSLTETTLGIGSTLTGKDGMTLLYVPAGEFTMGSEDGSGDEKPIRTVVLDAFWIDKTEITNTMYAKCVEASVCDQPGSPRSYTRDVTYFGNSNFDDYPVLYVNWYMAKAYCEWADRRLPTEAEWEKTARGTNGNTYPWGSTFDGSLVNLCDKNCPLTDRYNPSIDDGFADTSPVGNYPNNASPYGALDMIGNVWEWVNDWYDGDYYSNSSSVNPQGPESGQHRVIRGTAWDGGESSAYSANRYNLDPSHYAYYAVGFRCAMNASP